jgi:hypothetical protein
MLLRSTSSARRYVSHRKRSQGVTTSRSVRSLASSPVTERMSRLSGVSLSSKSATCAHKHAETEAKKRTSESRGGRASKGSCAHAPARPAAWRPSSAGRRPRAPATAAAGAGSPCPTTTAAAHHRVSHPDRPSKCKGGLRPSRRNGSVCVGVCRGWRTMLVFWQTFLNCKRASLTSRACLSSMANSTWRSMMRSRMGSHCRYRLFVTTSCSCCSAADFSFTASSSVRASKEERGDECAVRLRRQGGWGAILHRGGGPIRSPAVIHPPSPRHPKPPSTALVGPPQHKGRAHPRPPHPPTPTRHMAPLLHRV